MSSRPNLFFNDGLEGKSEEAVQEMAARISPALQVKGRKMPPLMLFHGTADPLVPLQQSRRMVEVMREAGNEVELLIKEGGGHPWLTIPEEVIILTDWFDKQLRR